MLYLQDNYNWMFVLGRGIAFVLNYMIIRNINK